MTDDDESPLVYLQELADGGNVPPPRAGAVSCVSNNELVVFGGVGLADFYNDLYALDLDTLRWECWGTGSGECPTPRGGACGVLVSRGVFCVCCGRNEQGLHSDAYVLEVAQRRWHRVRPNGRSPPPREDALAVAHAGHEVVLYGGTGPDSCVRSDLWVLHTRRATWNLVSSTGESPRRGLSAAAAQPLGPHHALVFGGYDGESYKADLYTLDLCTYVWRVVDVHASVVPRPRTHCAMWVLPSGDAVVFGGYAGAVALADGWAIAVLPGATGGDDRNAVSHPGSVPRSSGWVSLPFSAGGNPVSARGAAAAAAASERGLLLFGGCNGTHFLSTVAAARIRGLTIGFGFGDDGEERRGSRHRGGTTPLAGPFRVPGEKTEAAEHTMTRNGGGWHGQPLAPAVSSVAGPLHGAAATSGFSSPPLKRKDDSRAAPPTEADEVFALEDAMKALREEVTHTTAAADTNNARQLHEQRCASPSLDGTGNTTATVQPQHSGSGAATSDHRRGAPVDLATECAQLRAENAALRAQVDVLTKRLLRAEGTLKASPLPVQRHQSDSNLQRTATGEVRTRHFA